MSMETTTLETTARFSMSAYDGTFADIVPPAPRRAPYLYLTFHSGGIGQTIRVEMTRETSKQLYDLADRAEEYWEAWDEYQRPEEPVPDPEPLSFVEMVKEIFAPLPPIEEPVKFDVDKFNQAFGLGEREDVA